MAELPPLSRPPRPPVPEYEEIVEDVAELVRRRLARVAPAITWVPEAKREPYFDEILLGSEGLSRYRFSLKVVDMLTPAILAEVLEYARVLVSIFSTSRISEQHAYLLVGRSVRDVAPLYERLEAANRGLWLAASPFASRAYVAYMPGLNGAPRLPGVERADPPLQDLQLVSRPPLLDRPAVLVVDDDPLAVAVLEDTLSENGYQVDSARDWAGFRDSVMGNSYSALLLDVNLPGLTGDKMALFVSRFLEAPRPRIILHSGMEEAPLADLAHRVGAHGYLCKGGSDRQLLAVVEAAVAEYAQELARTRASER
jgi:CheY-like chemotaxis protein